MKKKYFLLFVFILSLSLTLVSFNIYKGNSILSGTSVTSSKPSRDVIIQGANVKMKGKTVVLHPKTTIINSNVEINGQP